MTARRRGGPIYGRQDHPDPYVRLLVRARVRKGLPQRVIAKALGVSVSMVSKWESGVNKMFPCQLEQYADLVGVARPDKYRSTRDKIMGVGTEIKVVQS